MQVQYSLDYFNDVGDIVMINTSVGAIYSSFFPAVFGKICFDLVTLHRFPGRGHESTKRK